MDSKRMWAKEALQYFGLPTKRMTLLQDLVNTTFRLSCSEGRFLVRLHRAESRSVPVIASELAWLAALSEQTSIIVQRPLRMLDGQWVRTLSVSPYPVTVLTWLDGRPLSQDSRTSDHFRMLGRLIARLHQHAEDWSRPDGFSRPAWMLPEDDDLAALRDRLAITERAIGRGRDQYGLIHGDLSFGNVLFTSHDVTPIDFEDCGDGYFLYDLAVVLAGAWGRMDYGERQAALVNGYREVRPLPVSLLRHLPVFMACRAGILWAWAKRQAEDHPWLADQERRIKELLDERASNICGQI